MALELNYQSLKTANSVRESVSVGVLKISEIQPLNYSAQSIYTSELFPQNMQLHTIKTQLNNTITCAPLNYGKKQRKPLSLEERHSSLATISIEMERFYK